MGAIIEVKYYNSFWSKKIKEITDVTTLTGQVDGGGSGTGINVITLASTVTGLKVGMKVEDTTTNFDVSNVYITKIDGLDIYLNKNVDVAGSDNLEFGPLINFDTLPKSYAATAASDWFIEEARIRGGYNNTTVDFGVKAYAVDEVKSGETRTNALIYSGVYNSRTGINQTNQFSVGQDITKGVDPAYGSIQKIYAEDSNLIIFQEDKVSRALIDKDAIYSAEGGGTVTSANVVIGQIVPYAGEFGISTEPESFAVYGYRKYFTDRKRNAVLRLSQDGLEEISRYGMTDWWRDQMNSINLTSGGTIVGGYDNYNKKYDVAIRPTGQYKNLSDPSTETAYTLSFDETSKGWTSFHTYYPDFIASLGNNFYSFKDGRIWKHYASTRNGDFYDYTDECSIDFILNPNPSSVKVFKTINYEGTSNWAASISTNENTSYSASNNESDAAIQISYYRFDSSLGDIETNWISSKRFLKKEDKYFANLVNNSTQKPGEVIFGNSIAGLKGFWANVRFAAVPGTADTKLFAVSTEYVQSSY